MSEKDEGMCVYSDSKSIFGETESEGKEVVQ
jgi:hypothetical protein